MGLLQAESESATTSSLPPLLSSLITVVGTLTIYTLKFNQHQHQFPDLFWHKKQKLVKMSFSTLLVYLEFWFCSISLYSTSADDAKNKLTEKISLLQLDNLPIEKPTLPSISLKSTLLDYIRPRLTILFSILDVSYASLAHHQWS